MGGRSPRVRRAEEATGRLQTSETKAAVLHCIITTHTVVSLAMWGPKNRSAHAPSAPFTSLYLMDSSAAIMACTNPHAKGKSTTAMSAMLIPAEPTMPSIPAGPEPTAL